MHTTSHADFTEDMRQVAWAKTLVPPGYEQAMRAYQLHLLPLSELEAIVKQKQSMDVCSARFYQLMAYPDLQKNEADLARVTAGTTLEIARANREAFGAASKILMEERAQARQRLLGHK